MDELRTVYINRAKDLVPDLPEVLKDVYGAERVVPRRNGCCNLLDCLHNFTGVEALEDDFKPIYQCSVCAKKCSDQATGEQNGAKQTTKPRSFASRRAWLWPSLPPILTLQLKRFQRGRGSRANFQKSSESVDLPPTLDLSEFMLDPEKLSQLSPYVASDPRKELPPKDESFQPKYELYALCVHQGSSLQSGHYIAYVNAGCSLETESWYNISDTHVSRCSRQDALNAEAYIAFYRREGLHATAAPAASNNESEDDGDQRAEPEGQAETDDS